MQLTVKKDENGKHYVEFGQKVVIRHGKTLKLRKAYPVRIYLD